MLPQMYVIIYFNSKVSLFVDHTKVYASYVFKLCVHYIKFHINTIFRCLPDRYLPDNRINRKLEVVNFSSYLPYTNNIIALLPIFLYYIHI